MMRRTLWLAAIAALIAPVTASAINFQIEGFYGLERPPTTSFSAAVSGTTNQPSASDLYKSSLQLAGGDVLLNLNGLELGAIADVTFGNNTASQTALGALVGLGISPGPFKLDLLAEAGGHRYGNFAKHPDVVTSSSSSEWLAYVGLRPGISFQVAGPVTLGVWGFVRWDVTTHNLPVTVGSANAGSAGSYKLGGTTLGATLRLGIGF
jgi:hypothetical protein